MGDRMGKIAIVAALGALLAGCIPLDTAGRVDAGLGLVGLVVDGHGRCDPGVNSVPDDPNPPPGPCGAARPATKP
jgi:hypothetical protein